MTTIVIIIMIIIIIQKGSSWGLSFFRFLGAEFFRFLGGGKKNTAHHLHLLVQGHGSGFLGGVSCFVVFFGFFGVFAHKHQENQKTAHHLKTILC